MVSVSEATSIIRQHLFRPEKERIKIEATEGRILAEIIKADRDMPPFDRVSMDGIAIQHKSFEEGWRAFKIEGMQQAGQPRITLKDNQNCIEVMTGAMLPIGCDTVIRYEDIVVGSNRIAKLKIEALEKGSSIHLRGHDAKRGDALLAPGALISSSEVTLLASVGRGEVEVLAFPKTAIVSTGNELVDIRDTPQPHQIRRSNNYTLQAALHSMGCQSDLFHVPDDRNILEKELSSLFNKYTLVILTGGVSKGKFDFVPTVLESLGVERLFHEVSQKPGKPFWFGVTKKQVIFALPGNPVSTFMCFYRYIKPWLLTSMGVVTSPAYAILAEDFSFPAALTYFLQVKVRNEKGKWMAHPHAGGGSGDFANLKDANGFLELPMETKDFKAGEAFPFVSFRKDLL